MRFRRRNVAAAIACLFAANLPRAWLGIALAQSSQETAPATGVIEKVTVTGTRIPAIDGQSGLPVQVITHEEIERANFQTAAQIVNSISATMSFSAFNEVQALGTTAQPGFAGAALRGLGYQSTLILLNGRRIANYAFTTIGGDLNAIPVSAIARVEVLKDGASAIYGSDAIAGVINFILRKDYQGAEAYAQYTSPEHTGGYAQHYNVAAGYGDLATQKFNVYAMIDYQKFGGIQANDRPYAASAYIPSEGFDRTDMHSLPANVDTPAGVRNPTGDPASGYRNPSCNPPQSFPTASSPNQCRWGGLDGTTIVDPSERVNVVAAFNWQITPDHAFFLNGLYTHNEFTFAISPLRVSNQVTNQSVNRFLLPPTSAFYPHAFASAFGIDGRPINVYWRATEMGARVIAPTSDQWNVVAGLQGVIDGWDYNGAFNYNQSDVETRYAGSYAYESALMPLLNSGVVNPFGPNSQTVIDQLSATEVNRTLRTGKSSIASLDFHATKSVYQLPAGPLTVAVGADGRRERLTQVSDPALESGDILNATGQPSFSGSRTVYAVFAEAAAPLLKSLEADLAVRYDHYSDFGGTTNPKLSLRWQPDRTLLLRASAGTGFLAPSLPGLFLPTSRSLTTGNFSDPARCPVTHSGQDCNRQFPVVGGGNPELQPIISDQWSVGGVWAPIPGLSLGVDYVSILLKNRIAGFSSAEIFAQCPDGVTGPTCHLIQRGPVDPNYPTLPGPIVQVDQFLTNLGNAKVTAVDVAIRYTAPKQDWGQFKMAFSGTYNIQNSSQQLDGSYLNLVGHYVSGGNPGVIPYWRHFLMLDWNDGPWSVTVTENFQTGGYDQRPLPNSGIPQRFIGDYDIWNIGFAYTGWRDWTLSAGIKNLADRDPPFSIQTQSGQFGYDPTYADPHGRLFWAGVKYAFR